MHKFKKVGATLAVTAGIVAVNADAASAANQDGVLNTNEAGFYYNSGCVGSLSDFTANQSNLAGYKFLSSGAGQGQYVKNNSACVANAKYTNNLRVYFNSGYTGVNDLIPAGEYGNLSNTYNENASFKWI